jgi:KDO2-lipid IV(A) lauroyltransferase
MQRNRDLKIGLPFLLFGWLLHVIGPYGRKALSFLLAFIWFYVLRIRRSVAWKNTLIAFPHWSDLFRRRNLFLSFRVQINQLFDFLMIPFLKDDWFQSEIRFHGRDHLIEAQKKGRGILFLGTHMGSGELAMSFLARNGVPLVLIGKHLKNEYLNQTVYGLRQKGGLAFLPPHAPDNAQNILRYLKENKALIFVMDQHSYPPFGINSTFFGQHVYTGKGLALFSLKTKAPVLPLYTYYDQNWTRHVVVGPEVPMTLCGTKEENLHTLTEQFNRILEQNITQHPSQWLWLHRRWKTLQPPSSKKP